MQNKKQTIENNQVTIVGKISSGFIYSHEIYGEGFYMVEVETERLSDAADIIPVMVSERLLDVSKDYTGTFVSIYGQFRSYNKHDGDRSKLFLSVFVREIEFIDTIDINAISNQVFLDGYICKEPIYRKTPLGREIADVLLAVNRPYGKSDYIPCICWGRNARYVGNLDIGTKISIAGRVQSRTFLKKIDEETTEERVAYELSASKVEVVEESGE